MDKTIVTQEQIRLRIKCMAAAHGSQKLLAEAWSISPQYLSDLILGKRNPSERVLTFLSLKTVVVEWD